MKNKGTQTTVSGQITSGSLVLQPQPTSPHEFMTESAGSMADIKTINPVIEVGIGTKAPQSPQENVISTNRSFANQIEQINEKSSDEEDKSDIGTRSPPIQRELGNVSRISLRIKYNKDLPLILTPEELRQLLFERERITTKLRQSGYLNHQDVQTDYIDFRDHAQIKTKSTGTQRPTQDEKVNELLEGVDARSVAQTQLNLLVETLENLKRNGLVRNIDLTKEDMDLIKKEMRKLIIEKTNKETQASLEKAQRVVYTGGSSFKGASSLNLGKKDPSLHYSSTPAQAAPLKSKASKNLGAGVFAARFVKKMSKKRRQ